MMRGIQKIAELDTSALLGGGAAGLGAYALTSALTRKAVETQREAMNKAVATYVGTRSSPIIAGAVTALLVAALVATKMRDKAQQPTIMSQQPMITPQQRMYQRQGFLPGEIVPFPAGHSMY
jgi:hypothetical protein